MFFRKKKEQLNTIQAAADGPLKVSGDFTLKGHDVTGQVCLCRCGATKSKPFCDGSHMSAGFREDGPGGGQPRLAAIKPVGRMTIHPVAGGPLLVSGPHQILNACGDVISCGESSLLCRCGSSARKPFCDGKHSQVNFEG